ncbi:antibiotic biosynthesis monooxygenase [Salinimonas marina]|uniref:Antibiotic biosynthesis monooxygenase n=1 Tax=Salinimonas marina TaxID=2785918 RepID=A0A7S9DYC6_9ALTE|nr:antibiotic biosynthesis monooxygenase [Salinimonas marina]QPG06128.1 antibiotic biosynthesis monooxygenase [Salinimonas marina]
MLTVVATLQCTEENLEHVISALKTLQFYSRQEAGCERYDIARRMTEQHIEIVITELWASAAALETHFNADHFTRFSAQAEKIVLNSEVKKYEVIEAE